MVVGNANDRFMSLYGRDSLIRLLHRDSKTIHENPTHLLCGLWKCICFESWKCLKIWNEGRHRVEVRAFVFINVYIMQVWKNKYLQKKIVLFQKFSLSTQFSMFYLSISSVCWIWSDEIDTHCYLSYPDPDYQTLIGITCLIKPVLARSINELVGLQIHLITNPSSL